MIIPGAGVSVTSKIMNIKMGNSADAGGGSVTECTAATSSGC